MDAWMEKEKMLPVTIYKDRTEQYGEDEYYCEYPLGDMVEIPVPEDLLWQWWCENLEFAREQCPEYKPDGGWQEPTKDDLYEWVYETSIADEADDLYDWLIDHNYYWKRLD